MEQISDEGRAVHIETALECEENKLLKLTLEVNQQKSDIDKRIQEKEEKFESTKRNHSKAMEQIQYNVEEESKLKVESVRMKKKLEADLGDLEGSLKRSSLESSELQGGIRRQQELLRSKTEEVEAARRDTDNMRDYLITAKRKVVGLRNAVEETRSMLEQADRFRRQLEQELTESSDEQSKLLFQNNSLPLRRGGWRRTSRSSRWRWRR